MSKKAAIIKGDGIGPELIDNALRVMRAVGTNVEFIICEGGSEWWERHRGDALIPQETWDTMGNTDACFKGPTTTPGGPGSPKSVAVSIRQVFHWIRNVYKQGFLYYRLV